MEDESKYKKYRDMILSKLYDILIGTGMLFGAILLLTGAFIVPVLLLRYAAQTFCSPL